MYCFYKLRFHNKKFHLGNYILKYFIYYNTHIFHHTHFYTTYINIKQLLTH